MLNSSKFLPILAILGAATIAAAGAIGCSSGTSDNTSGGSSGTTGDAGGDGGGGGDSSTVDSGGDAGAVVVNSCKTFTDKTAAGAARSITWSFPLSNDDRCWTIKKGQTVTFSGDFSQHPLLVQDGTKPSPITNYDMTTGKVVFGAVGTYGFVCGNHPQMTGAIQVVE